MGSDAQKRFFELAKQAEIAEKVRLAAAAKAQEAGLPDPADIPEELRLQPSDRDKPQEKKSHGLAYAVASLFLILLLGGAAVGGWFLFTNWTYQKPMDDISANPAYLGFAFKVSPDLFLQNLTVDVVGWPDDARKHELLRVLFQYAGKMKTVDIKALTLSCKGSPRFAVDGAYFKQVGENLGVEHDIKLIRTFPEHVSDMNGKRLYETINAKTREDIQRQLDNFSNLIDAWTAP
jgi:hypothetical protein